MEQPHQGELNWRLSAHPLTLMFFLGFRIGNNILYIEPTFGPWYRMSELIETFNEQAVY